MITRLDNILGCKSLHIATDHQPLVATLGKQWVADVPNKRSARIKEKLMPWRFNMVYNPGKTQNATDAISRCKTLHMMYVLAGQHHHDMGLSEIKELLEVDLETIHAAVNLVNNNKEDTMMSWDMIVIPRVLRDQVLTVIYAAHQGVSGIAGRIDDTVFWPRSNPDIVRTRNS